MSVAAAVSVAAPMAAMKAAVAAVPAMAAVPAAAVSVSVSGAPTAPEPRRSHKHFRPIITRAVPVTVPEVTPVIIVAGVGLGGRCEGHGAGDNARDDEFSHDFHAYFLNL